MYIMCYHIHEYILNWPWDQNMQFFMDLLLECHLKEAVPNAMGRLKLFAKGYSNFNIENYVN